MDQRRDAIVGGTDDTSNMRSDDEPGGRYLFARVREHLQSYDFSKLEDGSWPKDMAALLERHDALKREQWRNLPDDAPTRYKGHLQPGAAPHHYGPDDVVVDGDWLEANLADARLWRAHKDWDKHEADRG